MTKTELNSYITEYEESTSSSLVAVENWTKWRLYVNTFNRSGHESSLSTIDDESKSKSKPPKVIYAMAKDQISIDSKVSLFRCYRMIKSLNDFIPALTNIMYLKCDFKISQGQSGIKLSRSAYSK